MFTPASGGGTKTARYSYDALNRLVREDNEEIDLTTCYIYDSRGNMTRRDLYAFTTGSLPAQPALHIDYTYNDSVWKDLLTGFANKSIAYDTIGNPTSIGTAALTWTGRTLDSYTDGSSTTQYTYDVDGQRYRKDADGVVTDYYYEDGVLIGQKTGDVTLTFRYDEAGSPMGLFYKHTNGVTASYIYVKNLQGDIVGIKNTSGVTVATYTYDTWGIIVDSTDTDPRSIGTRNPLRYRGYYYDDETGFYYLNSRYYNPIWGRFLNADELLGANGDLMSYNLFLYCSLDPVNKYDVGGNIAVDLYSSKNGGMGGCTPVKQSSLTVQFSTFENFFKGATSASNTISSTIELADSELSIIFNWLIQNSSKIEKPKNIGAGTFAKQIAGQIEYYQRISSSVSKITKGLAYAAIALDAGIGIISNIQNGASLKQTMWDASVDIVYSLTNAGISAGAGALVGAAVGSVFPVAGNIVGAAFGFSVGLAFTYTTEYVFFNGYSLKDIAKRGNPFL